MAYIVTGGLTTFNLATHLDAQMIQLFALRELFSSPSRTVGGTAFSSYTGGDAKFAIDSSYNITWSGATYTFNGTGNVNFAGTVSALVTGSGGLGFGTGAGGTVTQLTNKSTSVTLNKQSGVITMNNAALAAGAIVGFTLFNSTIAVGDAVILTYAGGGASGSYLVNTGSVGAGSAAIIIQNRTGGSLSEAVVINFLVLKGATS